MYVCDVISMPLDRLSKSPALVISKYSLQNSVGQHKTKGLHGRKNINIIKCAIQMTELEE